MSAPWVCSGNATGLCGTATLGLQLLTDPRWAELIRQDLPELLTDHAWCEQKAASNAISMIVRYPELSDLVTELTRIAQEQLEHFGHVVERIHETQVRTIGSDEPTAKALSVSQVSV